MKTNKLSFFALILTSGMAFAAPTSTVPPSPRPTPPPGGGTTVEQVKVDYARAIETIDRGGGPTILGAVGGFVRYRGPGPVFVTLRIGGQSYSSPVDKRTRQFAFLVWANQDRFQVEAWTTDSNTTAKSDTQFSPKSALPKQ